MNHAKKLIVPVLCLLLGCAGGAAMGSVTAQTWTEPTSAQRWQQECQEIRYRDLNPTMRQRGEAAWELAGVAVYNPSTVTYCFKRPAP